MNLIITIINSIVSVFTFGLIAYILLKYFLDPYHPIMHALGGIYEPLLTPIRKRVAPLGGLDFSPMILIIAIQIVGNLLTALLRSLK